MRDAEVDEVYQAPRSLHLDTLPEPYSPSMLAFHGRIGRARFVAYAWWLTLLVMLASGLLMNLLGRAGARFFVAMDSAGFGSDAFVASSVFAVSLVTYLPVLVMARRRLHDLNHAGGFAFLVFLPLVNLLLILYLLLWPGDAGVNRFGPPATPNSLPVWLLGVALPLLLLALFMVALFLPVLAVPGLQSLWSEGGI